MGEHHFDSLGICVLCGRCDDRRCCGDDGPCDESLAVALEVSRVKLQKFFRFDRAGNSDG